MPLPMTSGRRLALAVGTPIALLVIGWTGLTFVAWAGQGSYPVKLDLPARDRAVRVEVDVGTISLDPGAGRQVLVTGTARYALFRSSVAWRRTAGDITVISQCRQPTGPCSFDYRVAVPPRLGALASVSSGDIHARGLSGTVEMRDQSGSITASALSGPRVRAQNESGDIIITGLTSRDVIAVDLSGNITLTFARVPDTVRISDESGDIKLVLPPGSTSYRVSASTSSGHTQVQVPTSSTSPHSIAVTDQSGNITVTLSPETSP